MSITVLKMSCDGLPAHMHGLAWLRMSVTPACPSKLARFLSMTPTAPARQYDAAKDGVHCMRPLIHAPACIHLQAMHESGVDEW